MLFLRRLLLGLCGILCIAYPIAVIGVTFDVKPPFSLAWAASALLFLEGTLLILAAMLLYGRLRGLCAGLMIVACSYLIEAVGVTTGFPFGVYRYTEVLFPRLPSSVPLAVMFAWVLIVLGAYGWLRSLRTKLRMGDLLLGAVLATLLDLEIEPAAAHIERYWLWLAPGNINYYGVPLTNFVAWFVVAFLLLLVVNALLRDVVGATSLAALVSRYLFAANLFMFGLVDLTHGYYWASALGALAGVLMYQSQAILQRFGISPKP